MLGLGRMEKNSRPQYHLVYNLRVPSNFRRRAGFDPDGELCMFEGLFQPTHLLVIMIIAIFVFGPKRLPEIGKGLGDGIRGFKDAMNGNDKPTTPPEAPKQ